jgi:hypothetical protein
MRIITSCATSFGSLIARPGFACPLTLVCPLILFFGGWVAVFCAGVAWVMVFSGFVR